ncbi:MAG: sialate O-acetylesterase, partial [Bacteroidota bacterium]
TGGGGGIHGGEDGLYMIKGGEYVSLAGEWKMNIEEMRKGNFAVNQIPSVLYNKMIHPLLNLPIAGALWYQGESNAGNERDATAYAHLFKSMIQEWRASWGLGDFPFLYVQLANFMQAKAEPSESNWALLRESQDATKSLINTAQAVIIDIGEADDIHPRNKQDVGLRLSLAARKFCYGEDVVYSGPSYKAMEKKEGAIYLSFDHIGSGLWAKDKYGYLKGFAIAGVDKTFVWAKAIIEGDKVKVWSEKVQSPQHVRYGWADNPDDANLYNREGLPASPFRTDKIE